METLSLGMALFSGRARIDDRLLHDGAGDRQARSGTSRRRFRERLLPPALLAMPLAVGLAVAVIA